MTEASNDATGYSFEGPSPADVEQAEDEAYTNDFATLVALFRSDVDVQQRNGLRKPHEHVGAPLMARVAYVLTFGSSLSQEQYLQQFAQDYGTAKVLRALARAIEAQTGPVA